MASDMNRGWRILTVAVVAVVVLGATVTAAIRSGLSGEGLLFALGTLSLLATGALLVWKVPENRLSWVMLLMALGDGLVNAADGTVRSRYNAQVVVNRFASSLRDRGDSENVVDGWVGVVAETMQPAAACVWVRESR
ncbi:MAG: hypothetical protein ABWZ58_08010 [Acidimicrobiia bacterium]